MSNPIDEEVYGERTEQDPAEVEQGNPGSPQAEFARDDKAQSNHERDPRATDHPAGEEHAQNNRENEPPG